MHHGRDGPTECHGTDGEAFLRGASEGGLVGSWVQRGDWICLLFPGL